MSQERRSKLLFAYGLYKDQALVSPRIIRNSFGKPMVKDQSHLFISMSHSDGSSALMISKHPIGIDLEKLRPYRKVAAQRMLSSKELAELEQKEDQDLGFFQLFTLKESYIKAIGCGLSYPVKTLEFHVDFKGTVTSNRPKASFILKEDSRGYLLSICRLRA